jgi:hypothetical protein
MRNDDDIIFRWHWRMRRSGPRYPVRSPVPSLFRPCSDRCSTPDIFAEFSRFGALFRRFFASDPVILQGFTGG